LNAQEEGKGKDEGMIMFFAPGGIKSNDGRKKKFHDKIKDVVDRVLEKQNEGESKVADAFLAENQDYYFKKETSAPSSGRPRRVANEASIRSTSRRPSVLNHNKLDLSWKDGGSIYPKGSSRVGDKYQVTHIPEVGYREDGIEIESSA
jgi:hypothetical protein